jgi:hypothetical protein
MLYFILVWTLLTIGCASWGLGLLNLLEGVLREKDRHLWRRGNRVIIATWLGMLAISIVLLTAALFVPLSPQFGGATLITGDRDRFD